MRRLLSSIVAAAFVLALGASAGLAADKGHGAMAPADMPGAMAKCPKGTTPVKAYKNKAGKWVKAYCRKSGPKMM